MSATKTILIIFSIAAMCGCTWSDSKRKAFEERCNKQLEFNRASISFIGFNYEELKTIEVIETKGSQILDKFTLDISNISYRYDPTYFTILKWLWHPLIQCILKTTSVK